MSPTFGFYSLFAIVALAEARYFARNNLRFKRQSLLDSTNPLLNPLSNPTGYDPSLLQGGVLTPGGGGGVQNPASASFSSGSGSDVEGGLSVGGKSILDGSVFSSRSGSNVGSGGVGTRDSIGVLGTDIFSGGQGTNFGPGGVSTNQGFGVAGVPIFSEGSGVNLGPGGVTAGDNVGVLGQDVFAKRSGLGLGQGGVNVGDTINAGPFDLNRNVGITGDENVPIRIGDQTSANVLGAEVFRGGRYTNVVPGSIPGLNPQVGGGLPNPYDPYGKYKGGWGIADGDGYNILGNGYDNPRFYGFDWPNDGVRVEDNVNIPIFGRKIAEYNSVNLNVKPRTISQWDFRDYNGFTTLGTGYRNGWEGTGGINGYDFRERLIVPVLGTNVVDQKKGSGFDLAKFKFDSGTDGQYGPIRLQTEQTGFQAPWLGQLIQRGMWDGALKSAGYGTGVPGGVVPSRLMPGVPFVG